MFESWVSLQADRPAFRLVDPPVAVVVDLGEGLAHRSGTDYRSVPLWVRRDGLDLRSHRPGRLMAWVREETGRWWAWVDLDVRSRSGQGQVVMRQLVPARAVHPASGPGGGVDAGPG